MVAGGGTAGHIEPALALADAVMRLRPVARVVALGTERGLENKIVFRPYRALTTRPARWPEPWGHADGHES